MSIDNVEDLDPRNQYTAAASQTAFDYTFPIFEDADLVVYVDGTLQVLTTNYTVTGATNDTGGTVTFVSAMVGGEIVTIYRDIEIARSTDVAQNARWSSSAYNDELDKAYLLLQDLKRDIRRALRIPVTAEVDSTDIELNPIDNWSDKYVTIDSTGKPVPAALSATTMTQAAIGALLYPVESGETGVLDTRYPRGYVLRYGTNTTPGTTDMTTAFQNASASSLNPYVPANTYKITGSTTIRSSQQWHLDGVAITITGTSTQVFTATTVNDWSMRGEWSVTGDNGAAGATSGSSAALVIIDCMRYYVDAPNAKNIKGWGVLAQPGSSTSPRAEHGVINAPRAAACYIGMEIQAGTGAEYIQVNSPYMTRNATAMKIAAGNVNVNGGVVVDNVDGMVFVSGANHAHGIITGVAVNHNSGFDFKFDTVTNGQTISGCHTYGNSIYFKSSSGCIFSDCVVDMAAYYDEGSQGCGFINCVFPFGAANTVNNNFNSSSGFTIWRGCKRLNGTVFGATADYKGVLVTNLSDGITITAATLAATTTLKLTDNGNVSANNSTQTLLDGYDASTGLWTCRGRGDGKVRVTCMLNISNNAADDMNSMYAFLQRNASGAYMYFNRVKISSTITKFTIDCVIDMSDTDTLSIQLASTTTFGNSIVVASSETYAIVEGL